MQGNADCIEMLEEKLYVSVLYAISFQGLLYDLRSAARDVSDVSNSNRGASLRRLQLSGCDSADGSHGKSPGNRPVAMTTVHRISRLAHGHCSRCQLEDRETLTCPKCY